MLSFSRVAFSFTGKGNVSKAYIRWKTFPFVICSSEVRKSQNGKQIVKQLYATKTKTAPNKPADSLWNLKTKPTSSWSRKLSVAATNCSKQWNENQAELTKSWSRQIRRVADFDNSSEQSSQMRKNKSKTWREISTFHYRSVRFSPTDSDLVAFRVICQDLNTMKPKTTTHLL